MHPVPLVESSKGAQGRGRADRHNAIGKNITAPSAEAAAIADVQRHGKIRSAGLLNGTATTGGRNNHRSGQSSAAENV